MDLKGKVALITGAGSGIGAAVAKRFAAEGAKICINDINKEGLDKVLAGLPAGSATACSGDISSIKDVQKMVEATIAFGGKINVVINSAGIDPTTTPQLDVEMWNKILAVNLTGPYILMKTAIPEIAKAGGGSFVNIASLAGLRFMAGHTAYSVSKGGLITLTQQAAVEYGPSKVRCNVICPGAVRTPMFEGHTAGLVKMMGKSADEVYTQMTCLSPLRRIGLPEDIAGVCFFLASDDSSLMTGGTYIADGGAFLIDADVLGLNHQPFKPPEKK